MAEVKFNAAVFSRHLKNIYSNWKENKSSWNDADALVIVGGKETGDPQAEFPTCTTLFSYLFQFELPDTIFVITDSQVWAATGPKKVRIMDDMMKDAAFEIPIVMNLHNFNSKDSSSGAAPYKDLFDSIKKDHGESAKIGLLEHDLIRSPPSFQAALSESGLATCNITSSFANLLVVKDDIEVKCMVTSASISKTVLKKIAVPKIEQTIDEGSQVKHSDIANELIDVFLSPEKISAKLAGSTFVDAGITPSIQSGGVYSLSEPLNNDDFLHFGCIIVELGARFKSYCSTIGRTYLVDAPDSVRKTYNFTLELHNKLIAMAVPGTKMNDVYNAAIQHIKEARPELLNHFVSNCGSSIGLENQESPFFFDSKCDKVLTKDMIVTIRVGFENVELVSKKKKISEKWKTYSTLLNDTIQVQDSPNILTELPKKYSDISYSIEEEEEEAEQVEPETKKKSNAMQVDKNGGNEADNEEEDVRPIRTRRSARAQSGATDSGRAEHEAERQAHQAKLAEKLRKEALIRFDKDGAYNEENQVQVARDYLSYSSPKDFPSAAQRNRIFVDNTNETLLLPIYGQSVPFHIMTVKTVTKRDNYLRLTFKHPETQQMAPSFKNPSATFVKEAVFRISAPEKLNSYHSEITALKKKVSDRENKKAIEESLTVQETLLKSNGGPKLSNLNIRPALGGRKTVGTLETHPNGFRFTTNKKGVVDVTFKNIKHAFFQPAENDAIILIHLHLHHPIMIGKKKTNDVQFYTEVSDSSHIGGGRAWGDADEIEQEQAERQMLNKLNKQFKAFCDNSSAHVRNAVTFDSPFRNLGFDGITSKDNVFLMPTTHCLVSLIVAPFFIVTLDEVEIVFFERVQFTLRHFDMVFVFKDYKKAPVHVTSIPRDNIEPIRDWLDSCDVKHYSGPINLNWKKLMKEILEDPKGFWEEGGWDTIEGSDSEDSENEGEERVAIDEEEDEFQPSGSDSEDYAYADDDDDDSYGGGGDDEDDYEEEEEEEAEDWEEVEEKARADDARRNAKRKRDDDDEDERPAKRQRR